MSISPSGQTGYLAAPGFEEDLRRELELSGARGATTQLGRLFLCDGPPLSPLPAWAQNVWYDVQEVSFSSISEANKALRSLGRNWVLLPHALHRRAHLIEEKLPRVSGKPLVFGAPLPRAPLGSWTLVSAERILAAARCESAFAHGEARFVEDHEGPPSRAYLKLWELITLLGERGPRAGERCLDLGSSPGGWTWVLAGLGARVVSVDKAPLEPRVLAMPGVEYVAGSAFAPEVAALGPFDWLFSDVICYPRRLLEHVLAWRAAGLARSYACTIKFQGATEHDVARAFAEIPGSRVLHLSHNKHELTFVNVGNQEA